MKELSPGTAGACTTPPAASLLRRCIISSKTSCSPGSASVWYCSLITFSRELLRKVKKFAFVQNRLSGTGWYEFLDGSVAYCPLATILSPGGIPLYRSIMGVYRLLLSDQQALLLFNRFICFANWASAPLELPVVSDYSPLKFQSLDCGLRILPLK